MLYYLIIDRNVLIWFITNTILRVFFSHKILNKIITLVALLSLPKRRSVHLIYTSIRDLSFLKLIVNYYFISNSCHEGFSIVFVGWARHLQVRYDRTRG